MFALFALFCVSVSVFQYFESFTDARYFPELNNTQRLDVHHVIPDKLPKEHIKQSLPFTEVRNRRQQNEKKKESKVRKQTKKCWFNKKKNQCPTALSDYAPAIEPVDKMDRINKLMAETTEELKDSVDKVFDRGEKLESLDNKTDYLLEASKEFEKTAKKLNPCCCFPLVLAVRRRINGRRHVYCDEDDE